MEAIDMIKANSLRRLLVGLGVLVIGCSKAVEPGPTEHLSQTGAATTGDAPVASVAGPERPIPIVIGLGPEDRSTALGADTTLQVAVSNLGSPVGSDLLTKLALTVSLRTWPELDPVPTAEAVIQDAKSDSDSFAHVSLSPKQPLVDRWYAVVVGQLPEGLAWAEHQESEILDAGEHVNRFRPDSSPVLRSVRLAKKDSGAQALYVEFSERMVGEAGVVIIKYSDGADLPCARQAVQTQGGKDSATTGTGVSAPTKMDAASDSFAEVLFTCEKAIDLERGISLSIGAGLTSVSGVALSNGTAVERIVVSADWISLPNGVQAFAPDDL